MFLCIMTCLFISHIYVFSVWWKSVGTYFFNMGGGISLAPIVKGSWFNL